MVTSNAKNLVKQLLSSLRGAGLLAAKDVGGTTRYIANYTAYPSMVTSSFALTAADAGISVGSGTTAAADTDYQLETPITSGLTASVSSSSDIDSNGNTYVTFVINLENISGSDISISEIGYKQEISASDTAESAVATDRVFLLDRTVFDTLTIADGEEATIEYRIKSAVSNSGGVVGTKNITANGTYNALDDDFDGYSNVVVNVTSSLGTKSITANGTYTASSEGLDGYSSVSVNVGGAVDITVTAIASSSTHKETSYTYDMSGLSYIVTVEEGQ